MHRKSLDLGRFSEAGLYVIFSDGNELALTRRVIDALADEYLSDPEKLSPGTRKALDFQPCRICPMRDTAEICHAIPSVFPLLEDSDRYLSHEYVTALFRDEPGEPGSDTLHVVETTMQRALQYVSILGLMYYCEIGRKYFKYFKGVIPFMNPTDIAEHVYLNIYWEQQGDTSLVRAIIAKMQDEIAVTTACQVKRLKLMCDSDAIANAFVNTQVATQILEFGVHEFLEKRLASDAPVPGNGLPTH